MESNDSSEIPDRKETSAVPGLPSGQKNGGRILKVWNIDEQTRSREIRQKKRNRPITSRLLRQAMVAEGVFFNIPDNIPWDSSK